jgi:hypothetical protein
VLCRTSGQITAKTAAAVITPKISHRVIALDSMR